MLHVGVHLQTLSFFSLLLYFISFLLCCLNYTLSLTECQRLFCHFVNDLSNWPSIWAINRKKNPSTQKIHQSLKTHKYTKIPKSSFHQIFILLPTFFYLIFIYSNIFNSYFTSFLNLLILPLTFLSPIPLTKFPPFS